MAAPESPLIITEKNSMRKWSRMVRAQGKSIGLVPTMGYLHKGHLSLIKEARQRADLVVVSIYVNPGQFSPAEDLSTYPRDFHGDLQKLNSIPGGVDVVFHPHNLYNYEDSNVSHQEGFGGNDVVSCVEGCSGGMGHETWVRVERLEKGLCGKSRPVFFRGVATIVTKLFNIVEPDVVVFGKKDYQQWRIIQRMVRDLDFGIIVIGYDIVREEDGLAMSSRNVHLSPADRQKALSISRSLTEAKVSAAKGKVNCRELRDSVIQAVQEAGGVIDYAEIVDQESLEAVEEIKRPVVFCIAAWFGKDAFDLESVAIHAIGHSLGLDHSRSEKAVMNPQILPGVKRRDITVDDMILAKQFYALKPEYHYVESYGPPKEYQFPRHAPPGKYHPPDYHFHAPPHPPENHNHHSFVSSPTPSQLSSGVSSILKELGSWGFRILVLLLAPLMVI